MKPANPEERAPQTPQQSPQTQPEVVRRSGTLGFLTGHIRQNKQSLLLFAYFANKLHQIAFSFQFRTSMAAGIKLAYSETRSKQSQQTPNVHFIAVQHSGTLAANAPLSWEQFDSSLVLLDLIASTTANVDSANNGGKKAAERQDAAVFTPCLLRVYSAFTPRELSELFQQQTFPLSCVPDFKTDT